MNTNRPLNDRTVRLFCIPALGLLIPNVTGLITNRKYGFAELAVSYVYFIFIAFIVWEGNVRLMYFIKKKFAWQNGQYYKIIASLFFANIIYSGFVSLSMLYLWKQYSKEVYANAGEPVINTTLVIIIAATFITNIYEMVFLNDEREYNLSRVEQLNIAKAQAELEALKNQIDPHFIFNSLNTLSFLIMRDAPSAKLFNDTLAKVYRYILGNKDKDLVLLREEVEFISNYFYLLKIRFHNAVNMEIEINDLAAEDFLIPPISMQALVENAIKHNDFNDTSPLNINVTISSNYIVVRNPVKPKAYMLHTSKIGLSNLDNRYKLITKKNIIIENNPGFFSVKLPVLKF
ncbi:MAG: histidine kinase [Bacteroidetes bacterium]|nr:histidine kinase [Bacteroidota bacterium]